MSGLAWSNRSIFLKATYWTSGADATSVTEIVSSLHHGREELYTQGGGHFLQVLPGELLTDVLHMQEHHLHRC
jgi:hypothetical protein